MNAQTQTIETRLGEENYASMVWNEDATEVEEVLTIDTVTEANYRSEAAVETTEPAERSTTPSIDAHITQPRPKRKKGVRPDYQIAHTERIEGYDVNIIKAVRRPGEESSEHSLEVELIPRTLLGKMGLLADRIVGVPKQDDIYNVLEQVVGQALNSSIGCGVKHNATDFKAVKGRYVATIPVSAVKDVKNMETRYQDNGVAHTEKVANWDVSLINGVRTERNEDVERGDVPYIQLLLQPEEETTYILRRLTGDTENWSPAFESAVNYVLDKAVSYRVQEGEARFSFNGGNVVAQMPVTSLYETRVPTVEETDSNVLAFERPSVATPMENDQYLRPTGTD